MKQTDLPAVHAILGREYRLHKAPIVDLIKTQTGDPFLILVATILSSRTKDETTAAVCRRLFRTVRHPADLARLSLRKLEALVYPIGFYRTKARHLRQLPQVLNEQFGGRIPQTIDELCELPGVGRKVANLVVTQAFDKPGICVDVHVHRISNRLGLIRTRSPFKTEMTLRRILPSRYWKTWNSYLVSFGQTVCRPVNPHCNSCPIRRFCARIGVAGQRPRSRHPMAG